MGHQGFGIAAVSVIMDCIYAAWFISDCRISAMSMGLQKLQNFCNMGHQELKNFCGMGHQGLQNLCSLGNQRLHKFLH